MSNETKKFAGLESLQAFLDGCKTLFASITHKHTMSDITDYTVDEALSDSSTNPVQNKVINEEFDAIADAMGALELAIDSKANKEHVHDAYESKDDAQSKYDELSTEKKDKDIIVTYADSTRTTTTHTSQEIYAAINEGTTVYFNNGGTNFHYLEGAPSVVNFYNCFYNNNVMQADVYEIRGNKITNTHFQNNIIKQSDIDTSVNNLKNDLLNGAGDAYDTLKELGDLIDDNQDAIEALEKVAAGKADKTHNHDDKYDAKGASTGALNAAKEYADTLVSSVAYIDLNDNTSVTLTVDLDELSSLIGGV